MPCIFAIAALLTPRIVVVVLWLFTDWFRGHFGLLLWPVLGLVFLPTTLLWYTAVQNWFAGEWGIFQIAGIVLALMIDMSPAKRKRRRTPSRTRSS